MLGEDMLEVRVHTGDRAKHPLSPDNSLEWYAKYPPTVDPQKPLSW